MSTARRPKVIDLFNAHLADDTDLWSLSRPPRRRDRSRPSRARTSARASRRPAGAPAPRERSLLVVLDGSEAARRAVAYVGRLVGRHRGFRVCVAAVLPELPSDLLEHGGAGDPQAEKRLGSSLRSEQRRWVAARRREARGGLDDAVASLRRAGLSSSAVTTRSCGPVNDARAADEILGLARSQRCGTVVVGRRRLSWFEHLFAVDLPADLARRGGGIAIWGVA
jgi:nucleotide-binding universal stress UspA family protein